TAYVQVARAFLDALEARVARGEPVDRVASVASFFVSRIDVAVDGLLAGRAEALQGRVAIANARLAYQDFKRIFSGSRWEALAARGARVQRVLWASTGTKNPRYSDVMYVEELIGPDTVNTIPPATLAAFRDHGRVRPSLEEDVAGAEATLAALAGAGISLDRVTDQLLVDAVRKFVQPFEELLAAVQRRVLESNRARINGQSWILPPELAAEVAARLEGWDQEGGTRRLWAGDAALWTGSDEAKWLGWLGVVDAQLDDPAPLHRLHDEARREGFTHLLLLGMGGSSLCPEVLAETLGPAPGSPRLLVLDSTDPAEVRAAAAQVDLARTLVVVSSKSGSTLEPNILKDHFLTLVPAGHFLAVTDPGSSLERDAAAAGFRRVHHGIPSIGGRWSALSNFGMVPAAAAGMDFERLLDEAARMLHACAPGVPAAENPGLALGTLLGVAARRGLDKLTLVASPGIAPLGAWLEQLLAESTGKEGKGIIPVDREEVGSPDSYGPDRLFAYLRLEEDPEPAQDAAVEALERDGRPVVRIGVATRHDLAEEFVRWEVATAIAGSVLGINPFDQPDVEASKVATRELTEAYERTGELPAEAPLFEGNGLQLFTDAANAAAIRAGLPDDSLAGWLAAHLGRLGEGDYFALLAWLRRTGGHTAVLQALRHRVRDRKRVATCLGFGPRFLHSTGQAYKGGPATGVFLQVTCEDAEDLPVPGRRYTFGVVKAAQAAGDFRVLAARGRRVLRVHLGPDVAAGLATLDAAVAAALA
ncbi:MAG TPA: bifunctional transaldolase/phosoglucose isomerase, partial [Gemmatimonadales bacterium]|nr:bifunctional transaldolase/phosoglucose isomerase [Gemmatimonadales bacterium]